MARVGSGGPHDVCTPNLSEWSLRLHPDEKYLYTAIPDGVLLCCPEDRHCTEPGCLSNGFFCSRCQVPVCKRCSNFLHSDLIVPEGLINDNVTGYLEAFIYEARVT